MPGYEFPEDAARAIALAARHGRWRARAVGLGAQASTGLRSIEAAAIISQELARGDGWLSPASVAQLLDCYGLPLIATRGASHDAEQAVARGDRARRAGRAQGDRAGLVHKSDAGGVAARARRAPTRCAPPPSEIEDAVAQRRAPARRLGRAADGAAGVELIVGVVHDHSFGPVLACGAGGTTAELLSDVAVRITPLTDLDAREMLRSLRTFPLLDGYRGAPRCDVAAIEDVLLRVSAMVEAHPEIVELDCNPLIAGPDGAVIVDARVRVETPRPPARCRRSRPRATHHTTSRNEALMPVRVAINGFGRVGRCVLRSGGGNRLDRR